MSEEDLNVKIMKHEERLNSGREDYLLLLTRIYQVPEGSEGSDMVGFVKDLMTGALQKPSEVELKI